MSRLFIEVELAFFMSKDITAPLASEQELMKYTASVAPAIELPDVNFGDLKRMTGMDVIASNVGSRAYIVGKAQKTKGLELDKLQVTLYPGRQGADQGGGQRLPGQSVQGPVVDRQQHP